MSGAQFIAGKAEEVMPGRLDLPLAGLGEVVGVVDPPRNGLRESPEPSLQMRSLISSVVRVGLEVVMPVSGLGFHYGTLCVYCDVLKAQKC